MKDNKAFTLVELLAVIIILAAIGLIIFPIINRTVEKSREKTIIESLKGIIRAAEVYRVENNNNFGGPYSVDSGVIKLDKAERWKSGTISEVNGKIHLENFYDGEYCASGTDRDLTLSKGEC